MIRFMGDGNVRVMAESPGVDIVIDSSLTEQQIDRIKQMASQLGRKNGYFAVDFTDKRGNTVGTLEYEDRISGNQIAADIREALRTGEVPESVEYSITDATRDMVYDSLEQLNRLDEKSMTPGERQGFAAYREQYDKYAAVLKQIDEQNAILMNPESTADAVREAENRLEILNKQAADRLSKLQKSSRNGGMQKLSARLNSVYSRFIEGHTNEELSALLDDMESQLKALEKSIANGTVKVEDALNLTEVQDAISLLNQEWLDGMTGAILNITQGMNKRMNASVLKAKLAGLVIGTLETDTTEAKTNGRIDELVDMLVPERAYQYTNNKTGYTTWAEGGQEAYNEARALVKALMQDLVSNPEVKNGGGTWSAEQKARVMESLRKAGSALRTADNLLNKSAEAMETLLSRTTRIWNNTWDTQLRMQQAAIVLDAIKTQDRASIEAVRDNQQKTIELLKSKQVQKLMEQQQAMRDRLALDRAFRQASQRMGVEKRKISRNVKKLASLRFNEQDYKNIPEELKPAVEAMLRKIVNHDAVQGGHPLVWSWNDARKVSGDLSAVESIDHKALEEFGIDDDVQEILDGIEQDLYQLTMLDNTNELTRIDKIDTRVKLLTDIATQCEQMAQIVKHTSEGFRDAQGRTAAEMAEQFHQDNMNRKDKKVRGVNKQTGEERGWHRLWRGVVSFVGWDNLTPEYFFRGLHDRTMTHMNEGLHKAENDYGLLLNKSLNEIEGIAERFNRKSWGNERVTFTTEQGRTLTMSTMELLSVYATWNREHQGIVTSQHLERGGIVLANRYGEKQSGARISEKDMQQIRGLLTQEQMGYADAMVGYLSNEMSKLGNETSMKLFGIAKYKEGYYFPIASSKATMFQKSNAGSPYAAGDSRLKHPGWSKSRIANANNAVVIDNFDTIALTHVNEMLRYSTFTVPIEAMNRALNTRYETEDGSLGTMRSLFGEKFGPQALNYLTTYMADIQGMNRSGGRNFGDKLLSAFKSNAVVANASVMLQQPLSFVRAAYVIDARWLALSGEKGVLKGNSYKEMMEHSGIAVLKKMGKFDMGIGRTAVEYLMGAVQKDSKLTVASNLMTAGAEYADEITWAQLWRAVKLEQQHMNKGMDFESSEFLDGKVAPRFNEVIRLTQVYDSVLQRSQLMRKQDFFSKTISAFKAEPTVTLNMLADAWMNHSGKEKAAKVMSSSSIYIIGAILQAIVKGIAGTGRKDDENRTLQEQFAMRFTSSLVSEAIPLNMIPMYSEIISLIGDGSVDNTAFSAINNLIDAGGTLISGIRDMKSLNDAGSWYKFVEDGAGALAQLFGPMPVKNVMRDLRATVNLGFNAFGQKSPLGGNNVDRATSMGVVKFSMRDSLTTEETLSALAARGKKYGMNELDEMLKSNNSTYYDMLFDATISGDEQAAAEISDYLYLVKLTGNSDPLGSVSTGLKGAAKRAVYDGRISLGDATTYVMKNCPYSGKNNKRDYTMKQLRDYCTGQVEKELEAGTMTYDEAVELCVRRGWMSRSEAKSKFKDFR